MLLASCHPGPLNQVTPSETQTVAPYESLTPCAATQPPTPAFHAPLPYSFKSPFEGEFWYGSDSLWTSLPNTGSWPALPQTTEGYSQKIFLWRKGYSAEAEPRPKISITGERLDSPPLTFTASGGTNAFGADIGEVMLIGVTIPSLGCWKITGKYANAVLTFVIRVTP
jgi:hypothetical protein